MNVKKCDRCGKIYEDNKVKIAPGNKGSVITGVVLTNKYDEKLLSDDLCDECIIELLAFLHGESKESEENG